MAKDTGQVQANTYVAQEGRAPSEEDRQLQGLMARASRRQMFATGLEGPEHWTSMPGASQERDGPPIMCVC